MKKDTARDYNKYFPDYKKLALWITVSSAIMLVVGYVFFEHLIGCIFSLFVVPVLVKLQMSRDIKKNKELLLDRFKVFISSMNNSVRIASKPVEVAFHDALKEMVALYGEKDIFVKEMQHVSISLKNNNSRNISEEFMDFARRTHVQEIVDFAGIIEICRSKNTSAISKVINDTNTFISDMQEVKSEISAVISESYSEFVIIMLCPTAFILYMNITMGGMLDIMYTSFAGRLAMTATLVINLICFTVGQKMIEKEI